MNLKRVLCDRLPEPGRNTRLGEAEARHAMSVCRLTDGDSVEALDGQGRAVTARLRVRSKSEAWLEAVPGTLRREGGLDVVPLRLEQAVLKGEAMEWAVEKAVELGVAELVPLVTVNTVVRVDGKGAAAFQERWQRIADQALKQCGRLRSLAVREPVALAAWLSAAPPAERLVCDEGFRSTAKPIDAVVSAWSRPSAVALAVGPEGGWTADERALLSRAGAKPVSLGPLVLRAETATIAAAALTVARLRGLLAAHPAS